jgi:hypothetical protein
MTTIADLQNLHSTVETPSGKFLCFTRVDNNTLHLCASDGYSVWKLELDPRELEAHRDLADVHMDAYLAKIKLVQLALIQMNLLASFFDVSH